MIIGYRRLTINAEQPLTVLERGAEIAVLCGFLINIYATVAQKAMGYNTGLRRFCGNDNNR
jgi:hypothetical protein